MIRLVNIYKKNGKWYVSGSSEVFDTREEALKRTVSQRTKKAAKSTRGRKYISERLGMTFRSTWEIELAEMLTDLGIHFEYEPKRFYFRAHNESYLPDFYLPEFNCWIEVKGYFDERSQKRCKLFKRYHGKDYGFFMWMKEERELMKKNPELIYTFIEIANNEKERCQKHGTV
jgi:hypothetical protein